jgi:hypothetical protein
MYPNSLVVQVAKDDVEASSPLISEYQREIRGPGCGERVKDRQSFPGECVGREKSPQHRRRPPSGLHGCASISPTVCTVVVQERRVNRGDRSEFTVVKTLPLRGR